jgi:hypothetical protein
VCVVYDQQQHACAITTASAIAGTTVAAGTAAEEKVQLTSIFFADTAAAETAAIRQGNR